MKKQKGVLFMKHRVESSSQHTVKIWWS